MEHSEVLENKTLNPFFAAEQILRQQSIAAWRHPHLTIDRLAEKITSGQFAVPEKYQSLYQTIQKTIVTLRKENPENSKFNDAVFDYLIHQERYVIEQMMDKVLCQTTPQSVTLDNLPYYLLRYMQKGSGEYIESDPDPTLHGVLLQRLLTYGFLSLTEFDFIDGIDHLLQGTYLTTSLLRGKDFRYGKKHVKGLLIRHLFGSACCALSLTHVREDVEEKTGRTVRISPAFDEWDHENKVDGVIWNKENGKIMACVQSKPGAQFFSEKEKRAMIPPVEGQYHSISERVAACQYNADYWAFPMHGLLPRERIEADEIQFPSQYRDKCVQFINGALELYHTHKDYFEDDWQAIFYTSRILLPGGKSEKTSAVNIPTMIQYAKQLMDIKQ